MRAPNPRRVWSTVNLCGKTVFVSLALLVVPWQALAAQDDRPRRPGGRNLSVTALKVGTVHPVSGPAIENGVILMRGGRILGVGPADKVRIPESATVWEHPNAHAYPGLVDALSNAFTTKKELSNASTNAGTDFHDALDASDEMSRNLIRTGITTAYVSNRSTATWRGLGAIIRPHARGFSTLRGKRHGGVSLRMTTGDKAGHALDRLKQFDNTGNVFDTLEAYQKQQKDYAKALEAYEKDYQKYLDHFRKTKKKAADKPAGKSDGKEPAKGDDKGAPTPRDAGARRSGNGRGRGVRRGGESGGRRGGFGGRRGRPEGTGARPAGRTPTGAAPKGDPKGAKPQDKTKSGDKAPKKPKWPKPVKKDDAKEVLLKVVDGKLPLRVEVHRRDEIRAALFMVLNKELPGITLEFASDAGDIAGELAEAGSPVVVTDLLPSPADIENRRDRGALPATLHAAGVPVAIASGSVENARNLTMMAAYASGRGLPEDAAVRALTLTPAEILGVDDLVGSLARNKVADVLVTSGPLLRSDTRVVRVVAQGRTQYEAK